ncbi:dephospho-CoA kinase [Hoeflea sp.]|uniref:dephospho-CoA kinase n=1 Tax=Hoeflea sp. TaxID=1940281 RepID=UPI002AFFB4E7|nr:dephospho-CoA kinase [Hoeflea sp.]
MIVIGLTGSIGMGKSTTAEMFSDAGIPVISADEIVHELYRGEAVQPIEAAFPGATVDGAVDREALSRTLLADPAGFKRLEAIIHPLVRAREQAFVDQARADGHAMVLVDIPLLYETGAENRVDVVVVVTCDADIQRQRVMARPGMTVEKFEAILARQVPDVEKRARAHHIVDTGQGLEPARRQVADIIAAFGASKQG